MPQLVGRICTICQERVPSELDGHFCQACGNPVHAACSHTSQEANTCGTCGTNHRAADRAQAKEEEARQANIRQSPPPPPLDVETAYRAYKKIKEGYQSITVVLTGLVIIGIGMALLLVSDLRSDPKSLSTGEWVAGLAALLVGVVVSGLGLFSLRK